MRVARREPEAQARDLAGAAFAALLQLLEPLDAPDAVQRVVQHDRSPTAYHEARVDQTGVPVDDERGRRRGCAGRVKQISGARPQTSWGASRPPCPRRATGASPRTARKATARATAPPRSARP